MLIFLVLFFAMLLGKVSVPKKNEFFLDYCSPQNTSSINAVFSILIFLSHAVGYVELGGIFNTPYFDFRSFIGQGVVVTYLFYSGYGMMESIKKKGMDYVKTIPTKRFFKLWYHFAIVVLMYVAVGVATGKRYEIKNVLLAFTGYTTVGNSNWYLFVTFATYVIIFISFMIFRNKKILSVAAVFVLTALFIFFEYKIGLPSRFYNTIICLPVGMLFSMAKPYFEKIVTKHDVVWFTLFSGLILVTSYFALNKDESVNYFIYMVLFVLLIVVTSMKVKVKSSVLDWFGSHIFSFFILQRIPMMILKYLGFNKQPYIFILLCFFATVFLSFIFDEFTDKLDSIIYKPRKKKVS